MARVIPDLSYSDIMTFYFVRKMSFEAFCHFTFSLAWGVSDVRKNNVWLFKKD